MRKAHFGLKVGIATLAIMGAAQATSVSMSTISDYKADTTWQNIKGTSYTWLDGNSNNQVDIGEKVTFTVDMQKAHWGEHDFDALKIWIDGTPILPPSTTLKTQNFVWDFDPTNANMGNSSYDYKVWTGGDKFFSFDYTFATAGTFDLTGSVMCSADLGGLVSDGAGVSAADWNAWGEDVHGPGVSKVHQGETERYQLKVYSPIPEPGTISLFMLGFAGLVGGSFIKRKKA